jgi:hypothetical protein
MIALIMAIGHSREGQSKQLFKGGREPEKPHTFSEIEGLETESSAPKGDDQEAYEALDTFADKAVAYGDIELVVIGEEREQKHIHPRNPVVEGEWGKDRAHGAHTFFQLKEGARENVVDA